MSDVFAAEIARQSLTIKSEFVPFSASRNAKNDPGNKPNLRSLNWKVTLQVFGRDILTTEYSAGVGHCPSYDQRARWTLDYTAAIVFETEKGKRAKATVGLGVKPVGSKIEPGTMDVIASFAIDASVIDYGSFEDWASEFGYDADSRSAEATYRACLETALKLRNALGEVNLAALREAATDY